MKDYRCTQYCPSFEAIPQRKPSLLREIRKGHPRAKNIYTIVHKSGTEEHRAFFDLYNNKCAYCGCSVNVIPAQLFNVDHIKPKADKTTPFTKLNAIENLVLSCRTCNAGKSDFWFQELSNEWSPDGEGIATIFVRDDLFNILIGPEYNGNVNVKTLFEKLRLGEQHRRLDYLLMSIYGYVRTLPEDSEKRRSLLEVGRTLQDKRNRIGL